MKFIVEIFCDEEDSWTLEERNEFETLGEALSFCNGFNKAQEFARYPGNYTYRAELRMPNPSSEY